MFSPEFNLEREFCNTSISSSHTWIRVGEEIKGVDICYIKGNILQ